MSCSTCDHTMHKFTEEVFWCPRCGTLKLDEISIAQPFLIGRCKEFSKNLDARELQLWWKLGIEEAINTGRKQ